MKKIIAALCFLALTAGCADKNIATSDGKMIEQLNPDVMCYEGVKYAKFSIGELAWGGAQMTPDNKAATCETNDNPSGDEGCYKGVVYVKFSVGKLSWGSAKYNKEGNVVTCGAEVNKLPVAPVDKPASSVN